MTSTETERGGTLWRALAILAVTAAGVALLYLSFLATHHVAFFDWLRTHDLLWMPTVAWLWVARIICQWWWVFATVVVGLDVALASGRLDRQARAITIAAVVVVATGWFALWFPLVRIYKNPPLH